jgi:opacity protein-like surface antigen
MFWRFAIPTLAAFAALTASPAVRAADMPLPPSAAAEPCCNWYLRGFVGVGMSGKTTTDYLQNPLNSSNFAFDHSSMGDTPFIGGAIGYEFNNWLRFDASAEYRARTRLYSFGHYTSGGGTFLDTYEGNLKSYVFLVNGFVDLGTWNCFTPFIGAGIGGAYNTLSDLSDINPSLAGYGFGRNPSEWHMAYALYAGIGYAVSKNLKVDLSYRYLNYGSITDTVDCIGGCNPDSFKFGNFTSHDIMLGLRWTCCDVEQPRQVYMPLHSKG